MGDRFSEACLRAANMFAARSKTRHAWSGSDEPRPEQKPPPGDWFVWLILAGRGWGKTRTLAEWAAAKARRFPGCRIAVCAATFGDGRDTLVEGESGLLNVLSPSELRGGSIDRAWNRSLGELFLGNGSRFKIYSSEKPRQLRGPQHHFAMVDELAFWKDAHKGTLQDTTWSNLVIGTRLPAQPDWDSNYRSQICVATTPRPVKVLNNRNAGTNELGLMQRATTHITRGATMDNLGNLSRTYREQVVEPLLGTRLGRQELDAELLEDVEGALWQLHQIDYDRVISHPELFRTVIGVDPAVTSGPSADETGIIVAGIDRSWRTGGHGYVIADYSGRMTPAAWGKRVCEAAVRHRVDAIVAEKNQGHALIVNLIDDSWAELEQDGRTQGIPKPRVVAVNSKVGKRLRAEPISGQYENRRWHHVGSHPQLEDQQTTWIPGESSDSPDRLDALVHAATQLTGVVGTVTVYGHMSQEAGGRAHTPSWLSAPVGRRSR